MNPFSFLTTPSSSQSIGRRFFVACGLLSALGALYLILRGIGSFLHQPASRSQPSRFPLLKGTELKQNPAKTHFRRGIWLIRDERGWYGLKNSCTHLGCQPTLDPPKGVLVCPCHGSRFNLKGEVLHGPATRSLSRPYLWIGPNLEVWVDLKRIVEPDFRISL